jgi:RHS repeat-associated protein
MTQTDTMTQTVPYFTNGQQRTWTMVWNPNGLLQSVNGPLAGTSDTVSYTYDVKGNIATITNAVGQVTAVNSVDLMGRPTQVTEASGRVTTFTYTPRGWLKTATINPGAGARTTSLTYDAAGNVVRIDQPDSRWSEFTYNGSGWLTEARSSANEKLTYQHDLLGNVTRTDFLTGAGASQSHFVAGYDELGRLRTLLGGASDASSFAYDRSDRPTTDTDGLGRSWLTAFDPLDRVISVTDPESQTEQTSWSTQNEVSSFADGRSLSTTYVRNGFSEVIREVSPDRGTTDYWYDAAGRVTRMLSAAGRDQQFTYDSADRILTRTFPNQSALNVTFTYDSVAGGNKGVGRLTGLSGSSSDRAYVYNLFGELTSETWQLGSRTYALGYAYNASGDVTTLTLPSGRQAEYSYDSAGRLSSLKTKPSSTGTLIDVVSSVTYAPYGPPKSMTYGNGAVTTYTLDASYRATRLQLVKSGSTLLDKTYAFDANSRVTGVTDAITTAASATYDYTLDGRLSRSAGAWGDRGWTYDAVGNRAQETRYASGTATGTTAYVYPASANRLTSLTPTDEDPARAFTYTADGHMSSDTRTGLARVFTYDQAGRLSQVADNGGTPTTYAHDTFERRVTRTAPGEGLRHFVFLANGRLAGEYDGATGAVIAEYLWLGDALVGEVSPAGVITYVQTGSLGQPLAAMDQAGAVVWRGELAPFGELVSSTGTSVPKLRFAGQWTEPGSGLHQNWHRTYDATIGRYLEADPLGIAAGQSLYGYVGQDPANAVDPMGLFNDTKFRNAFIRSGKRYVISGGVALADSPVPGPADAFGAALAVGTTALILWDIGDAIFSPPDTQADKCTREEECEEMVQSDDATCRALPMSARGRCWRSAAKRRAACYAGQPIPELDTWWSP